MATDTEQTWFDADVATFGDRITGSREAAGVSQQELSLRLGVRLKTVQGWEEDMLEPRGNKLQMLAGMLNVSIRWLLTGEGDGLDKPADDGAAMERALSDLTRVRARMDALSRDMAQVEDRLRLLIAQDAA